MEIGNLIRFTPVHSGKSTQQAAFGSARRGDAGTATQDFSEVLLCSLFVVGVAVSLQFEISCQPLVAWSCSKLGILLRPQGHLLSNGGDYFSCGSSMRAASVAEAHEIKLHWRKL